MKYLAFLLLLSACNSPQYKCQDQAPDKIGACWDGRTIRVYKGALMCLCPDSPRMKDSE